MNHIKWYNIAIFSSFFAVPTQLINKIAMITFIVYNLASFWYFFMKNINERFEKVPN